jgi:hypothetical protein
MGVTGVIPDRELATTVGVDDDGDFITLYRTEWLVNQMLVDATPWARSPVQAIKLADEMDNGYQLVLAHSA